MKSNQIKSNRMEQLAMIPHYGKSDFQLKRLEMLKADGFEKWTRAEKAFYYKTARKLIERKIRSTDRYRKRETYYGLLRNRYETFIAQVHVEDQEVERLDILIHLSTLAEHEEGKGEGEKYFEMALDCLDGISPTEQQKIVEEILDFFPKHPDKFLRLYQKVTGLWEVEVLLDLSIGLAETMTKAGTMDRQVVKNAFKIAMNCLRDKEGIEQLIHFYGRLTEIIGKGKTDIETEVYYYRLAYQAAMDVNEPYLLVRTGISLTAYEIENDHLDEANRYLETAKSLVSKYGNVFGKLGGTTENSRIVEAMEQAIEEKRRSKGITAAKQKSKEKQREAGEKPELAELAFYIKAGEEAYWNGHLAVYRKYYQKMVEAALKLSEEAQFSAARFIQKQYINQAGKLPVVCCAVIETWSPQVVWDFAIDVMDELEWNGYTDDRMFDLVARKMANWLKKTGQDEKLSIWRAKVDRWREEDDTEVYFRTEPALGELLDKLEQAADDVD